MSKRRFLQFSVSSWLVFTIVFSGLVALNVRTRQQNFDWQFFTDQAIGIVLERGWPLAFQSELRSKLMNPTDEYDIDQIRSELAKEDLKMSVLYTRALLVNIGLGALISVSFCFVVEILVSTLKSWSRSAFINTKKSCKAS